MAQYEYDLDEDLEIREPSKYKVLLLNDDYSTMDFVIEVLVKVFRKTIDEASSIMLEVHHKGKAICGIYPKEIASTKVAQVSTMARSEGFPLKAILEEE